MAQITGRYQNIKSENFAAYLTAIGYPADKAKEAEGFKLTYNITKDGDKIIFKVEEKPEVVNEYIINKEVDEKLLNSIVLKTTTKVDGDTIILSSKTPKGRSGTRTHKFKGNEVEITYRDDDPKVPVAVRVFKRL